jgi:hypothetical protein
MNSDLSSLSEDETISFWFDSADLSKNSRRLYLTGILSLYDI